MRARTALACAVALSCGSKKEPVVAADATERAVALLTSRNVPAWVAGTVERRPEGTHLVGAYR